MNFVMFPMFFFSSALYPLWKLREGGSELLYYVSLANPVHPRGRADPFRTLRHVRAGRGRGRGGIDGGVLSAGGARLRSAARHAAPRSAAGMIPLSFLTAVVTGSPLSRGRQSEVRLIGSLRDLVAHRRELVPSMRRARTRDRHLGKDARGAGGEKQQPVGKRDGLVDIVRDQQGRDRRLLTSSASSSRSRAASASSSETKGSSSRRRSGSTAKARASATRRASPSDSSPG